MTGSLSLPRAKRAGPSLSQGRGVVRHESLSILANAKSIGDGRGWRAAPGEGPSDA